MAGWHDPLLASDLEHFAAMRSSAATEEARGQTRLVVGPWTHGIGMHSGVAGEVDFGARASGLAMDLRDDMTALHLRWFDRWVKNEPTQDEAPVRIFVMGRDRWQNEEEWPPTRAIPTAWYLHADGGLSRTVPEGAAEPRRYLHDPSNPVPTIGGGTLLPPQYRRGCASQEELLNRQDVLVFTSAVLTEPVEVIGQLRAVIWASTSARDADWIVKVCDVGSDGHTVNICDGIVRTSLRDSRWSVPHPVEPYTPVELNVDLLSTAMVFEAGHRLRVLVMSSDFPRYDRNPGTGESSPDAHRLIPAVQQVFCDRERPSYVELPTIR